MKLLFVIDSLQGGGAARVTTILANEMVKNNFEVVIATNLAYRKVSYDVDSTVKVVSFYSEADQEKTSVVKIYRHARFLRKIIKKEKPDVIIGEQEGGILYSYLANFFINIPLIGHRHNTFKILGISTIYRMIYKMPDKTVLLHNTDVRYVKGKINNIVAIYNPHTFPIVNNVFKRKKHVICVGSIDRWYNKGLDIMIKMWSEIAPKHEEWTLIIVGSGSDDALNFLKKLTIDENCSGSVVFKGQVSNVDKLMQEASIFALPSRVEGFPMVLNEAISQGCPSITFSLDGVVNEIYSKESVCQVPDGDTKMFVKKLEMMMDEEELRNDYSKHASSETIKYLPNIIIKEWIALINEVVNSN